jgi:membrane associated rhomboid family serine protease
VDCVREQARGSRAPRTVFGGGMVRHGAPRVTQSLIAICGVAYILQIIPNSSVTSDFLFAPVVALDQPYRFITSAFLHSPGLPLHILFNMYALWLTGPYLEALLGRVRFLALYLISALGGSVFFLLLADPFKAQQWNGGAVGASGAVFGLFAALVVVNRRLGREFRPIITLIVLNAVLGFVIPNVAWQAHLGGLLTGAAVAAVMVYAPRTQHRALIQAGGVLAVIGMLAVVVAYKAATVAPGAFL